EGAGLAVADDRDLGHAPEARGRSERQFGQVLRHHRASSAPPHSGNSPASPFYLPASTASKSLYADSRISRGKAWPQSGCSTRSRSSWPCSLKTGRAAATIRSTLSARKLESFVGARMST